MAKNEAISREVPPESTNAAPPPLAAVPSPARKEPAPRPEGYPLFLVLTHPSRDKDARLTPRVGALMTLLMVAAGIREDKTPAEVCAWADAFKRQNPHAWHAALAGDFLRFSHVMRTGKNAAFYQSGVSKILAYEPPAAS